MNLLRAALVEIDGSHDECLYSQLLFLREGGYQITLICSEDLKGQVSAFDTGEERLFYRFKGLGEWARLRAIRQIRNDIVKRGITTIIFNSAHGRMVRNLALMPWPSGTKLFGTLHGINKLIRSATQRIISYRIPHYFLLNDYLKGNLKDIPHQGLYFESYYPIFFPPFGASHIEKPADELWIAIPGQVEQKRRDYERLIKAFASISNKSNYRFLLLGRSNGPEGGALKRLCESLGVKEYFRFWDGFMENGTFHAYLRQCDIVMPLIHPGNDGYEKYLKYQITGGYNLAFAYKKPLLMLHDFSGYEDFKENAVFYKLDDLPEVLLNLPEALGNMQGRMYKQPKWAFEAQCARYLAFLKR